MSSKKIFIISTEFLPGPGGIGSHAYQVAKELHALGWDVKVFTEQNNCPEDEIREFNQSAPFKIFRLFPTPSVFLLIKKVLKLVFAAIRYRPDIILGTGKHGAWFGVLTGKLTFRKTAVIGHGTEFVFTASDRSEKTNKWAYSKADALIHVSNYTRKIAEKVGINNKNTHVINNGADGDMFYPLAEKQIEEFKTAKGIAGQKIIVTVGHVQPRKGHEFVIRAMPGILKNVPNAHYYCVGPRYPLLKTEHDKLVRELGVTEHVHFTDRVQPGELLNWLNAADVFSLTSIATHYGDIEGFGIVVIEAALCGVPSVVTNDSGPAEAIIEGETGLGVKEKDVNGIAEKISLLLTNDALRKEMGRKARMNAVEARTWKIIIKQYDRVLQSLL